MTGDVMRAVAAGSAAVLGFSLTYPATVLALPVFGTAMTGIGRGALGLPIALAVLWRTRTTGGHRPAGTTLARLCVVAGGVVLAFPALSALALRTVPSSRAAVLTGLLPALVAVIAVARAPVRTRPVFWVAVATGAGVILVFAASRGGGLSAGDGWLAAALLCAAAGHVEGALLARDLGGARVIGWALLLAAPVTVPAAATGLGAYPWPDADPTAVTALAWLGAVSCSGAFVVWYHALSAGGAAGIGQLQLLQPLLTIAWSAALLAERIPPGTWLAASAVLLAVVTAVRTRPPAAENAEGTLRRGQVPGSPGGRHSASM